MDYTLYPPPPPIPSPPPVTFSHLTHNLATRQFIFVVFFGASAPTGCVQKRELQGRNLYSDIP